MAVVAHGAANSLLREFIKFLNGFPVDVDLSRLAENLHESRLVHLARNDFRGESQGGHERCEIARRAWMQAFLVQNVLLNGFDFGLHASPLRAEKTLQRMCPYGNGMNPTWRRFRRPAGFIP